jgi:hypothetical protein
VSQRGLGVIVKSSIPQEKILLPPLLSSIYFMSLAMFSISCMLVLFAYSSLSFLQLAFGEFGLLELCRLTLFKFHIKVFKTQRKPNSPPSWAIDPYTKPTFDPLLNKYRHQVAVSKNRPREKCPMSPPTQKPNKMQ